MRFLVQLTILSGSLWVAWHYGFAFGIRFTDNPYLALLGYPAVGLLPLLTFNAIVEAFRRNPAWKSARPVRYLIGKAADLVEIAISIPIALLILYFASRLFLAITLFPIPDEYRPFPGWLATAYVAAFIVIWSVLGILLVESQPELPNPRTVFANMTRGLRAFMRKRHFSKGGSARFAGMVEEWSKLMRSGALFIGLSLYGDQDRLGIFDDRHMMTIVGTRSGKGRSVIIPNLLMWEGSALVIDPKGTTATVTANRRKSFRQAVHVLDPFGNVVGHETSRFNPLTFLDAEADDFVEQVYLIVNALVVKSDKDSHWDETASIVIAGLIAWLAATLGKEAKLKNVLDLLSLDKPRFAELLDTMQDSDLGAELPRRAASLLKTAAKEERGSILSTAQRHLSWLNSPAMQKVLAASDFDLTALKQRPGTVYLVLPPEHLDTHSRFLRLFVSLTFSAFSKGGKGKQRLLMLLDEFHALGHLPIMEKAMGLQAGYNVCIWPFLQNLSQLKTHYPRNWETFIANSAAVQVFGVNDSETADYLVGRLGEWSEQIYNGSGVQQRVMRLLQANELGHEISRESRQQIVFCNGADPLLIARGNYDEMFDRRFYDPDPDHA